MPMYSKNSLELLRQTIDLVEVVSAYVDLKPSGSTFKGRCPFHDEKTPSFMIQRGDSHYHCFGCGAHGDAIAFLMNYMKMSFIEAIESLADRFQVPLEEVAADKQSFGPKKSDMKEALRTAMEFYHYYLLHTDEGHAGLKYLYKRGLDLDFIRLFKVGLAPKKGAIFAKAMQHQKLRVDVMEEAGLVKKLDSGKKRVFFSDRIVFPILDYAGSPIGFSARKMNEETFGPKYINSPETPLFKKSQTLYGLSFSRRRIAKEKRAIIVEGQIDALRLIQEGLNITVAGQGTAFTEEHVKELMQLGVTTVYLAFDGDSAGEQAASKIGHLFQKEGIDVKVVHIPHGLDPDTFMKEHGPTAFRTLLEKAEDYLNFLTAYLGRDVDLSSPSQKNHLIQTIVKRIRSWEHPLMVHESLRKLAQITQVPEKLICEEQNGVKREVYVRSYGSVSESQVNPDRILETDLLRWLFLMGESKPALVTLIQNNLRPEHFYTASCRSLFSHYFTSENPSDLLTLASQFESAEEQLVFSEIIQKKVNQERAEEGVEETVTKLLQRHWLQEREKIKVQIHCGQCSDEEILELAKKFDKIKATPPVIKKESE